MNFIMERYQKGKTLCKRGETIKILVGNKKITIDKCLSLVIQYVNSSIQWRTVGSCCGHRVYHATIFMKMKGKEKFREYFTGMVINPIKRRYYNFYCKDKNGMYYNPKVENYYKEVKVNAT